ncbi:MAG TPA: FkbM family methyltransferase [Stellaceae bacterium]|nr:FkbM family methyltransferase [Stellaceae bacterium]
MVSPATKPPPQPFFAGLIREASGFVLDIGANTGIFTFLAVAASPVVSVCAFEPLETARQVMSRNDSCNPEMASRITVEPFALSRMRAIVPFFETINDQGLISTSSSLEQSHAMQVGIHIQYEITTETLDDWAEATHKEPIRLVKIDVEGHEHAVIEGGRRRIGRHRPIIIVEVLGSADFSALDCFLVEDDYRDFALSPGGMRECASIRFHPDAWNHLLSPVEKIGLVSSVCQRVGLPIEKA